MKIVVVVKQTLTLSYSHKHVHLDLDGPCFANNGGCHIKRKCMSILGRSGCGDCSGGYVNDGAKGCKGLYEYVRVCDVGRVRPGNDSYAFQSQQH